MQNIRLFSTQMDALGQATPPIVYYIENFPKPMFAGTDLGETCNIVIDEEVGSAGIMARTLIWDMLHSMRVLQIKLQQHVRLFKFD